MAAQGHAVQVATRVLGASESGFYAWRTLTAFDPTRDPDRRDPPDPRRLERHLRRPTRPRRAHSRTRHPGLARHRVDADGTRRTQGRGGPSQVAPTASRPDRGRPGRPPVPPRGHRSAVGHRHHRAPHEGKVYCAVVLDACSRRVVGWSIDSSPTAALVTNALGMAIDTRRPPSGTVIHSDHGVQFGSWAFTRRARDSGLVPSMGSIGDCYDCQALSARSERIGWFRPWRSDSCLRLTRSVSLR